MIRRTSQVVAALALGLGALVGPMAASASAAPCPPGTIWDPVAGECRWETADPPDAITVVR